MGMEYISSRSWEEFRKRFKDATAFLLRAELEGELAHLESLANEYAMNMSGQQFNRLWELRAWDDSDAQIGPEKRLGAGVPFTIAVPKPITGETYYLQHDGRLYRATVTAHSGYFDRIPRYQFIWRTGPNAGHTETSYSQIYWRKPKDDEERLAIWNDLGEFERKKYVYLFQDLLAKEEA
jgi:hypothetical protein